KAIVPITEHEIEIKADEEVSMEYGTGLMMVSTWGDTEDVNKWKRHNLNTRCLIDEQGTVNEYGGPYQDMNIHEVRDQILQDLKEQGYLKHQEPITHVVQVSDRSGKPAEFIMTNQWFVRVLDFKDELLEQGKKLNWYPEKMFQAYKDWVESLKWDWCISRQRYFGVPLPVWYHTETGEVIVPQEDELPVDPTEDTPRGYSADEVEANPDVMDTWMTSSVSPLIASGLAEDEQTQQALYPMTLRPQGLDIIRTWLFYTVAKSYYHHDILPFRDAMISGQGLDNQGRKISKRLNNFTDPHKIMEQYGADALRYWATGANLGENLRYSEEVVKKGKKTVTKLFNVAKFSDMHVSEVSSEELGTLPETLQPEDRWILHHLNETIQTVTDSFEVYEYFKARSAMDDFFWHYLTDNYMEFIKHRLYDDSEEGQPSRDAARKVLYIVVRDTTKLYAPIMPY
ncbi:MAG: class I tRNA ligase family protein, partial [Candidatus Paceibacteria bacterium]